ncbi:bifunctional 2-polyprenyl-6-hydroxyphenol methylase/3-demethylubiquinol 3-O-methyltransferase UbiG [Jatrophihabitans endophyticus]|uniref:class I SAM-dependent methyltransferase n=1 Tax=Jatrophihabitans endophyticus TaxID=1206085 RepID=UPI0019DE1365|nr:class I SAM-dependent methyltransferase [Jatrophihabitans endophyticus]MBE7188919.1 class I SAM-dependent methyltransferase [Jatrophihabitans endophyticus]
MSSAEGKPWTRERIARLARETSLTVLDVGPGVGTYATLLAGLPVERMLAIEAWEPYLETYHLADLYDDVVVGDVRTTALPPCDVVILGDVVEHMTRDEGLELWRRSAEAAARAVYLSIPIVHYPQDEIEGNPYEVHVEEDWSHELVLDAFTGIGEWWLGTEVGVYERLTGGHEH